VVIRSFSAIFALLVKIFLSFKFDVEFAFLVRFCYWLVFSDFQRLHGFFNAYVSSTNWKLLVFAESKFCLEN
jgi:hypothetical protein